jgi:2-polyprenyl-6-hydroxyphenyl methylase/3-demethylubiquinone-9 3-methyltransferase
MFTLRHTFRTVPKEAATMMIRRSLFLLRPTHLSTLQRPLSSISPDEVSKFSKMSQSWWDAGQNPLIGMNPIRLGYIQHHVGVKGKNTLDVGCGGGLLSESLRRLGGDVVAIDPSHELVECAKAHSEGAGLSIDYRGGTSIEKLAEEGQEGSFDVICILEVLEHATDVDSMLQAASHLLNKEEGRLFVSTVNRTIQSNLLAIIGAEYIMRYLPPGTHDHSKFLSPELVEQKLRSVNLQPATPPQGMVLAGPPPPLGTWQWKLSPTDLNVNWIGCYQHS